MPGPSLPHRPKPSLGPYNAVQDSDAGSSLADTRVLVLTRESPRAQRLLGLLSGLGIETLEASSASGAAAVLRHDEARGKAFDFLVVDGRFGGICGMSLCAALCIPLARRPVVILQSSTETKLPSQALSRSGISAVIDPDFPREDLQSLLLGFRPTPASSTPRA